jgi:dolichol kinase
MADAVAFPAGAAPAVDVRRQTADRVFWGAFAFNGGLTAYWLYTLISGHPSMFFHDYKVDRNALGQVLAVILIFYVLWGFIWWGIKALLLRYFVGFTKEDRREAFSSRMKKPYDVSALTAKYSERRIRIADMVGRRGRFILMAFAGFFSLYIETIRNPASFGPAFVQNSLFVGVVSSWVFLSVFYMDGFLGAAFYGPQSRVMDGVLARANCLLITTLWAGFAFVMVPIGLRLTALFPPNELAAVFAMIWGAYIACDAFSEIIGSYLGNQKLRVWGIGDVNRKSVAGTVAGFVAALALCLSVVWLQNLGWSWAGLAVAIALSSSFIELYSPRGTDDFTMATGNALICLAFGAWLH